MRFWIIIGLFLSLLVVATACNLAEKEQQTDEILKDVSIIDTADYLREVTLDAEAFLENQSDGGGELKGFYEAGAIRKISLWVGISTGFETKDYYFKNDELIFVHEQFNSLVYDVAQDAFDSTKTEKTFDGRYYFANGKMLHYETTGHNRFEDDSIDPENVLLAEAKEYARLLSGKL